jgi:hypothetical protein
LRKTTSKLLPMFTAFAVYTTVCAGAQLQVEEPPGPGSGFPIPYVITGTVFTFSAVGGFPPCSVGTTDVEFCQFLNQSTDDWNTLEIRITPGAEPVACIALFGYDTCDAQQGSGASPSVLTFSGGIGIPRGEVLAVAGTGWPGQITFGVSANSPGPVIVPEPESLTLSLLGVAAIAVFRRRATKSHVTLGDYFPCCAPSGSASIRNSRLACSGRRSGSAAASFQE